MNKIEKLLYFPVTIILIMAAVNSWFNSADLVVVLGFTILAVFLCVGRLMYSDSIWLKRALWLGVTIIIILGPLFYLFKYR